MPLDRIDRIPRATTTSPFEPLRLVLRNDDTLDLPAYFYRAIVPILRTSGTALALEETSEPTKQTDAVATAFCILPTVFLTAAHVVPDDGATERTDLGYFQETAPQVGQVVPFSRVVVDRKADVAVCLTDGVVLPSDYGFAPSLRPGRSREDLSNKRLLTLGFPMPLNTPTNIALDPAAYAGDEPEAAWEERRFHLRSGRVIEGTFVKVGMKGLPGGSGSPLCVFDRDGDAVRHGRVVGIQSIGPDLDRGEMNPFFAESFFADIGAALRLVLPAPFGVTLGEVLAAMPRPTERVSWVEAEVASREARRSRRAREGRDNSEHERPER